MTPRERKYHRKVKNAAKRTPGCQYTSFPVFLKDNPDMFDSPPIIPEGDEPDYFKNFAMMIPLRAIKLPSKKELKKRWYATQRTRKFIPTFSDNYKPWMPLRYKWVGANAGEPVAVTITKEQHSAL